MTFSPAQRRYNRRVLVLSVLYALLLFAAVSAFARHAIGGASAYAVAVLPALPICGCFVALGRYLVEERDEYLRMLQVRQQLVASGITLAGATVWGFLEGFGLAPHLFAWTWAVVWFAGLGLGAVVNVAVERRAA